jgi:hypothetical protein
MHIPSALQSVVGQVAMKGVLIPRFRSSSHSSASTSSGRSTEMSVFGTVVLAPMKPVTGQFVRSMAT